MKKIFLFITACMVFSSCTKDASSTKGPAIDPDGKAIIEFKELVEYNVMSRATEEEESKIVELDLLLFTWERTEDAPEYFLSRLSIRPEDMDEYVGATPNGAKYFIIDLEELAEGRQYSRPMLFANSYNIINEAFEFGMIDENTTREDIHTMFTFNHAPWCEPGAGFPPIPMWGVGGAISPGYESSEIPRSTIILFRPFARIDIGVDTFNPGGLRDYFQIDRVYYPVSHPASTLTPVYKYRPDIGEIEDPHIPEDNTRLVDLRRSVPYVEGEKGKMERAIYMPESMPLDMTTPYKLKYTGTDGVTTEYNNADPVDKPFNGAFLIIEGTYKGEPNRFYRVDFHNTIDPLPIIRNYNYDLNISAVTKRGFDTAEEAAMDHSGGSGMETEITIGDDLDEFIYFMYDANYYIGLNILPSPSFKRGAGSITIKVITNYEGKQDNWIFYVDEATPWATAAKVDAGSGRSNLVIDYEENNTNDFREVNVYINSGPLQLKIAGYQSRYD